MDGCSIRPTAAGFGMIPASVTNPAWDRSVPNGCNYHRELFHRFVAQPVDASSIASSHCTPDWFHNCHTTLRHIFSCDGTFPVDEFLGHSHSRKRAGIK